MSDERWLTLKSENFLLNYQGAFTTLPERAHRYAELSFRELQKQLDFQPRYGYEIYFYHTTQQYLNSHHALYELQRS